MLHSRAMADDKAELVRIEAEILATVEAKSFERLEASLASLTHIAANQARLANWWSKRLGHATREAERVEEIGSEHPKYESSMKRVVDVVTAQGKAFDRIVKTAEQAVMVARTLGLDVGEDVKALPGVEASAGGQSVKVTGVKFKRSRKSAKVAAAEEEDEDDGEDAAS